MNTNSDNLIIDQILVGRFMVFSYLITDISSKEAIVIDPGAEPGKILDRIREREVSLCGIVCTHTHPDHIGAIASIKRATKAPVVVHEKEAKALSKISTRLIVRLFGGKSLPAAEVCLKDGDLLPLGSRNVSILHTPGHSPGSICLLIDGNLFSGDTLFVGGVGRTDLPGASWKELNRSLCDKIMCLPDNTHIWPGHDYGGMPSNYLGRDKLENPFLTQILQKLS